MEGPSSAAEAPRGSLTLEIFDSQWTQPKICSVQKGKADKNPLLKPLISGDSTMGPGQGAFTGRRGRQGSYVPCASKRELTWTQPEFIHPSCL